jgi:hypothetical protein
MENEGIAISTSVCPFCKEPIKPDALKCRHCQSAIFKATDSSSTEKIADLVVRAVGIVPIVMTLLFLVASVYGFKTLSDVREFAKQAENASVAIESDFKNLQTSTNPDVRRRYSEFLKRIPEK